MRYGTVVSYNSQKGFGFIRPDLGNDIFFHISALGACQAPPNIEIGQPVKYEVDPKTLPKRMSFKERQEEGEPKTAPVAPRAMMVELIEKIPGAMVDETVNDTVKVQHHPKARRKKPNWRR